MKLQKQNAELPFHASEQDSPSYDTIKGPITFVIGSFIIFTSLGRRTFAKQNFIFRAKNYTITFFIFLFCQALPDLLLDKMFGIHFFMDDYRFNTIYSNPPYYLKRLQRYGFLLTPDYSLYADMPLSIQINNVFKNRWCGAYWQEHGLFVIPTISWSLSPSFDFCFDGVEQGSAVAISTVGCRKARINFMRGYDKMIEKINPETIICYGKTFPEMQGNIIQIPYFRNTKEVA